MLLAASSMTDRLEAIKEQFFAAGDGLQAVERRSDVVDEGVVRQFTEAFGESQASGVCLAAVGGYGRRQLFPFSDVDLLFLFERSGAASAAKDSISFFLRDLWDGGLRISHSVRTPSECVSLSSDNTELHISLLDVRYLAGDRMLLDRLADRLPPFYARERDPLVRRLAGLTRSRHAKYGDTIYQLEPNIKDSPGGIRDFHLACWLSQLANAGSGPMPGAEQHLPADSRAELLEAKRFLFALRCYLHYFHERDSNVLTFEYQDRAAAEGGGKSFTASGDTAEWMRDYFRNVRVIQRLASRLLDQTATPPHSLFTLFRDRQSRLSNADFAVTRGLLYVRRPEALESDPGLLLRLFEFIARHGVPMAPETERRVTRAVPAFRVQVERAQRFEMPLWPPVAAILRLPHAYQALVAMREAGLLAAIFPEFESIDCLVVRDFYHRYTVDEHSLRTIKTLRDLDPADPLTRRFAELMGETEQPEVLLFALLFHDVGKGTHRGDHVTGSQELAERAMERLGMPDQDREMVRFLIRCHLEMSLTMTQRDLADPATVEAFAGRVATLERLRKLTLLTYADVNSVNPDALTPWRKDLLWQLYVATHTQLTREMEADRVGAAEAALAEHLAASDAERAAILRFLDGVPTRYLRIHTPAQIAEHFKLEETFRRKSVAVSVTRRHSLHELVVLATDRPFLFASIAGTLSSFAMNILKAEAFSNRSGMILDTFLFEDPNRTLELNPTEADRLRGTLERVVLGRIDVRQLLQKRAAPPTVRRPHVARQITFDNHTSAHDTLFHVITEDRPGLLYDLASTLSFNQCDIDVVLIDTEGHKAIDVFYVSSGGEKLDDERARLVCHELEQACRGEE